MCSYIILDNNDSVVVHLRDNKDEFIETHLDMSLAEKSVEQYIRTLQRRNYETD